MCSFHRTLNWLGIRIFHIRIKWEVPVQKKEKRNRNLVHYEKDTHVLSLFLESPKEWPTWLACQNPFADFG